jgi:phosphatidylserine/phosphatidylglycerophosphate/cardiolipin synthase-like enzyme
MGQLDNIAQVISAHKDELKQPGVVTIRPGYKLKDNWPTSQPAIVVVVSQQAGDVHLPASIEDIPVDVRTASAVEELRFQDPEKYAALAQHRAEFRGGAFPEIDPAATEDTVAATDELDFAGADLERGAPKKEQIPYTPANVELKPITGKIPILCHASPDAGWPTLKTFLSGVQSTLTVGLYDFTSKHILDAVSQDLAGKQSFELVLDHPAKNPTADQTDPETVSALSDALGDEFKQTWALVRMNKEIQRYIYPSAYHIKVAVRDGKSAWVSSGNWNNSNQPDMDPANDPQASDQETARKSDRDWHVVIDSPEIASQFEAYIKHDFEIASAEEAPAERGAVVEPAEVPEEFRSAASGTFEFHAPLQVSDEDLTITPLLTPDPDSYRPAMLNLINSAQSKLYIQLQYIHPPKDGTDEEFKALIDALIQKIGAGIDVRIICSEWQNTQGWLERLQESGVNLANVKIQNGVHNKGFVVDGRIIVLGSQNWSGDGVLRNRDASVIIESETAAQYYEKIFLHDWDRIAAQSMGQ